MQIFTTENDIQGMRIAGQKAAQVLEFLDSHIKTGVTTEQLDVLAHNFIVDNLQAIPAPLNYKGFPKSICTSLNHVICHGIPKAETLKNGDILNVDVTVIFNGFYGDTSKMYCLGKPPQFATKLCATTQKCLYQAIALVRPGCFLGDIGETIQKNAEAAGYSIVEDYCGHGIGKIFHDDPQVMHYGKSGTGIQLKEGMTFTIEPMINLGKKQTRLLSDGWTVVTADRSLSAQWEHTLLVTKNGCEILTLRREEKSEWLPNHPS